MKIDLHTYGKTPACLYLAYQLAQIGNPRLANRVGQSLTHFRELAMSLERANQMGAMNQHHVSSFANMLREVADQQHAKLLERVQNIDQLEGGEIVPNLVRNIMIGELKSLVRRGAEAKHKFKDMQRQLSDVPGEHMSRLVKTLRPKVGDFEDDINADTLMYKSLAKLERKGKISTLY
jgi:regulator of PEP synthase PpsR (kinase-PPPase family)